ncbi:MAG: hypothetical protein WBW28_25830, partial [Pseudolabrys sp.]
SSRNSAREQQTRAYAHQLNHRFPPPTAENFTNPERALNESKNGANKPVLARAGNEQGLSDWIDAF